MTHKKRILFVGEASPLATGFSNIYRSLLPRLAKTEKYIIGEIGAYIRPDDPRIQGFVQGRWQFWGNMPTNQQEQNDFNQPSQHPEDKGQNINQFGYNIFEKVVCEFQPDLIFLLRDRWMDTASLRSAFRPWVKILWKPTVDSPQQEESWIQDYEKCDKVFAYSDFGIHTLKIQSPKIKLHADPMRPGVDLDVFYPMDKKEIREKFNLSKDILIIGLLQRNQSRKNILDVIDSFTLMKKKYKGTQEIDKSVLLLHTSWPDNAYSFDYPRHIKRVQSDKWMRFYHPSIMYDILQTMKCHACQGIFTTFAINLYGKPIQNGRVVLPCSLCGQQAATCPNTSDGFTREQLAETYNLMDVLVQCSLAEGDGMPSSECKGCGVPAIVTDHSALSEKGRFPSEYVHLKGMSKKKYTVNKGGIIHKVAAYRHEPETGCLRAVPDIQDLAEKMHLLLTDHSLRQQMSKEARECAEENYDWDKIAKKWEKILDDMPIHDRSKTWDSPIEIVESIQAEQVPSGLSDHQYIEFLYTKILKYNKVDTEGAKMWMMHLAQGITREALMEQFVKIGNQQIDGSRARNLLRQRYSQNTGNVDNRVQEFI